MKNYWLHPLYAPEGDPPAAPENEELITTPPPDGAPPAGDPPAGDPPAGDPPKKSIYDDGGLDEPGKEGSTTWPDDWREQAAKGDEKKLKRLERYASPEDAMNGLFSMQQRVSSGEYKRALPEGATEEQVAEWRVEQGIPAAPSEYELPVTLDGAVEDMTEDQKAAYEGWQSAFHENNLTAETAAALTKYGNDMVEAQMEAIAELDAKHLDKFEDTLRADWGPDYRTNAAMNKQLLTSALGDDLTKELMNARMPNGQLLKNSAEFSKMLNSAARAEGISGNSSSGEVSGMTDKAARKAAIEEIQRTGEYTPALRKEYGELLAAMEGKGNIAI